MGRARNTVVEAGAIAIVLLLPMVVNPWAALPFEPVKANFLLVIVLSMMLLTTVLAVGQMQRRTVQRRFDLLRISVLSYGVCVGIATLTSVDPWFSFVGGHDRQGGLTIWGCLSLYLLLATTAPTDRRTYRLLAAAAAGSVPVCVYGLAQHFQLDPLDWQTDSISPVLSTMGRSNFLGAYLAVVIPLTLAFVWSSLRQTRSPIQIAVSVSLVGGQVACLLLTQARAGWLAFVVGTVVFLVIAVEKHGVRFKLIAIALLVCASSVLWATYQRSWSTEASADASSVSTFNELREESVNRRLIIWKHAILMVEPEYLLFGIGPGLFERTFNAKYPPGTLFSGRDSIVDDPHNYLIEQLLTVGVLGLLSWISMNLIITFRFIRIVQTTTSSSKTPLFAGIGGAVCAYWVQSMFNPNVIVLQVFFWLLLGLISQYASCEFDKHRRLPHLRVALPVGDAGTSLGELK